MVAAHLKFSADGADPLSMIPGFRLILASSIGERDGMAMELDRTDGEQIAEVFHDDDTGLRTFRTFVDEPIPVAAIEWLIDAARDDL